MSATIKDEFISQLLASDKVAGKTGPLVQELGEPNVDVLADGGSTSNEPHLPPAPPAEDGPSMLEMMMAAHKEAKIEKEVKTTEEEIKTTKTFGTGFKKGFFGGSSGNTKTTATSKPSASKVANTGVSATTAAVQTNNDIPTIVKPNKNAQQNKNEGVAATMAEEVKRAMSEDESPVLKQLKQGDWVTPDLIQIFAGNPIISRGLQNPRCQAAMQLMQKDPKTAQQRYYQGSTDPINTPYQHTPSMLSLTRSINPLSNTSTNILYQYKPSDTIQVSADPLCVLLHSLSTPHSSPYPPTHPLIPPYHFTLSLHPIYPSITTPYQNRYQGDPEVDAFLREFGSIMSLHFDKLGEQQQTTPANTTNTATTKGANTSPSITPITATTTTTKSKAQQPSLSTGTRAGPDSTGTRAGSDSTGTRAGPDSTGTRAGPDSTGTRAGSEGMGPLQAQAIARHHANTGDPPGRHALYVPSLSPIYHAYSPRQHR